MIPDLLFFVVILILTGFLLFLLVYFVILLTDVESDYLNAQQCCNTLNFWVIPKVTMHTFVAILQLITGHWWLLLCNLPGVVWQIQEIYKMPRGNMGIYDPTEIHNRGMVKVHLRNCLIFLAFYLIMFFVYMYCMIQEMLEGDPIRRHEDEQIITEF
ncbi:Protein cornichon like 4 [Pseudolycoriella hygida]|uniref:Protein cornichon like 4 n=1 Tax=Pseudolycoriella hygida TaxID=35572 RepID=A0A9Q0S728_9DIPT|nr:Protein cornichon like 4 [Pseudolycoriella hygida]